MKPVKSQKLRRFAEGKDCTLRLPFICSFDPAQTSLNHITTKKFSAMGAKVNDTFSVIGCSSCHDVIDGRNLNHNFTKGELAQYKLDALAETQDLMLQYGVIKV